MRGGERDEEGQRRRRRSSSQDSQDPARHRRASTPPLREDEEEEEEEGQEEEEEEEEEEGQDDLFNEDNKSVHKTGLVSTHKGNNSPRETIVLDASYPPPPEEYPDDDEDDDDDPLEVVVETLTGDTFKVRVSQWDTVAGLKNLLFRTQGIPMSQQHLILGQTELVDDLCLMEQGVVTGSTLRLVLAMRGGPINARRLPTHHDFLRDISEIVDNELDGEKVWEGNGGRTVTLLVLRDGDNVNIYRVVENQDGSFSPLDESFGSIASNDNLERDTLQAAEDGARTRARMKELQARMEAAKNKKKQARRDNSKPSYSQRSVSRASRGTLERHEDTGVLVQAAEVSELPGTRPGEPGSRPVSSSHRIIRSGKPTSLLTHRTGRGSRPTTQERIRRNSLSKSSSVMKGLPLKEIPQAGPRPEVDFTRKKPLDDIIPRNDRNRLSAVDEELVKGRNTYQSPEDLTKGIKPKKKFQSYRKSLVRHGKLVSDTGSKDERFQNEEKEDDNSRGVWPRREAPMPLYMPHMGSVPRRRYEGDRLNRSHNQDHLRVARINSSIRPKTSPEVLEHRPGSTGGQSTISDNIHLRAPDDRLRDICNILSNSRGNSRQSHRSSVGTPPDTVYLPSLSTSFSSSNGLSRSRRNNSVSVSLSSLKSQGATPPSPVHGALVASGTKEQRDKIRELMRNQTAAASSSRRNTPENLRQQGRRPGSGRLHASPPHLPPVTPQRRRRSDKPRCAQCHKRIKLVHTYDCRCGLIFCTRHRIPETHGCTFDFKTEGRKLIEMANPLIASNRLPKM